MSKKEHCIKKIISLVLTLIMLSGFAVTGYALPLERNTSSIAKEKANRNVVIDTSQNIVNLELCEGEEVFSDPREIALISKEYKLGNASQIAEIRYVPIVEASEMMHENVEAQNPSIADQDTANLQKGGASTSYYIKKK